MIIARQSTARTVTVGPMLDADGVAVTGGVVGDLKISKNGGSPAALNGSATLTHRHTGHYSLALTASDLDTVGVVEVVIDDTTNAMPMKEITVVEEAIYDALYAASATGLLPANVTQFGGSNGTFASGRPEVNTTHAAGTAWGSGAITAGSIAGDAFTAAKFASDVTTELQTGLATAAELAKVPKSDGTASWNATALAAINAQVDDVVATDARSEPTSPPAANASLAAKVNWLFMLAKNERVSDGTTEEIMNDAGSSAVGEAAVDKTTGVVTRGKWAAP